MLKIRLQRIGKPKHAYFRIAVLEHTTKAQGKYLELLGTYDPHKKVLQTKAERIQHWMSKGVQLTPSVNNLFVSKGVIQGKKVTAWKPKKKQAAPEQAAPAAAPATT